MRRKLRLRRGYSYGGELAQLTGLACLAEILLSSENIKLNSIHMRSEPVCLAEISLDFAGISATRKAIFPYEQFIPVRRDGIFFVNNYFSSVRWNEQFI